MSTSVTFNGTSYAIPAAGELNWAALSSFLIDVGQHAAATTFAKQSMRVATSSPVTVSASTDTIVLSKLASAGAVTVNLPAGVDGQVFIIGDQTGDAATNNITINRNGSDTINGATTYVIGDNRGCVILAYSSTNTQWNVVGRFLSGTIATVPSSGAVYSTGTALASETALSAARGGTGVANNAAATLTWSGNNATTFTTTNTTGVTLPTTGTLATLAGSETFTNKTLTTPIIASISNSGTITVPTGTLTLATLTGSETLTNKTVIAGAASGATTVDVAGDFATRGSNDTSTGTINTLDANGKSFIVFTASTTITLNGIGNTAAGKHLVLANQTGNNLTVTHLSASAGTSAQRICCSGGTNITVASNGALSLIYDTGKSLWFAIKP